MNRQNLKYTIFFLYYITFFSSVYGTFYKPSSIPIFGISLLLMMIFIITSIISIIAWVNDAKPIIFYPKLPKKVIHISGEYYIEYSNDSYYLYDDRIFYLRKSSQFNPRNIDTPEDLLERVKSYLDVQYSEVVIRNKRLKLLNDWDGYTSLDIKRDDKISKVIN